MARFSPSQSPSRRCAGAGNGVARTSATLAAAAMEKTLAEPLQRALLAQVIEQMPAGVIIAAPNGRLLLGNQQAERIWRHPLLASEAVRGYAQWRGFDIHGKALA